MIGDPTGEIWTDTQGEGHTEREAETGLLRQSHPSNSKDRGQPPEARTDSRDHSPSKPSGGRALPTPGYSLQPPRPRQSACPLFSAPQLVARYYNGQATNTVVVLRISKLTAQTFTAYKVWFRKFPLSFPPN